MGFSGFGFPGFGFFSIFGALFMLIFWGLIIALIVAGVRWLMSQTEQTPKRTTSESALDILKRRYAAGEIDAQEFEKIKKDLV